MARKTIVELQAELTTLIADNTSGLITPANLRQMIGDFIQTMTPAYAVLSSLAATVRLANITPAALPWLVEDIAQLPEFTTNIATGIIRRDESIASTHVSVNLDIEGPNNTLIVAELYANGVPTNWRAAANCLGAGRPVVLSLEAIHYSAVPVNYQIYVRSDVNGVSITFSNGVFLCSVLPVRTA